MKYRKKPVEIEAFQWRVNGERWPDWFRAAIDDGIVGIGVPGTLSIETLEGVMTVQPEDWIIRGVKGEIYPCKPDIFEMTYEAA